MNWKLRNDNMAMYQNLWLNRIDEPQIWLMRLRRCVPNWKRYLCTPKILHKRHSATQKLNSCIFSLATHFNLHLVISSQVSSSNNNNNNKGTVVVIWIFASTTKAIAWTTGSRLCWLHRKKSLSTNRTFGMRHGLVHF